ncbi:helix-turn-helix domain-containing protein [Gordonia sputi]
MHQGDHDQPSVLQDDSRSETLAERQAEAVVRSASYTFRIGMKGYREERGWSQRRLSDEVGKLGVKLDPSAITRIERGDREPKYREAVAISEALRMPAINPARSSAHDVLYECLVWLQSLVAARDTGSQLQQRISDAGLRVEGMDRLLDDLPAFGYSFDQPHDGQPSLRITDHGDDSAS